MYFLLALIVISLAIIFFIKNRFYAFLFLIPLSVYSQSITLFSIGDRGVNIGLDTIYILIILLLELSRLIFIQKKIKLKINSSAFFLLCFFVYILINSLITIFFKNTSQSFSGIIVFIRLAQYLPFFFILSNFKINIKQTNLVFLVFIITGLLASIQALFQKISGDFWYMKGMPSFTFPLFREFVENVTEPGLYAGSANYNVFAAFIAIVIMLSIALFFVRKERITGVRKYIFYYLPILIIGLYLSSSRISIIAILLGLVYFIYKLDYKTFFKGLIIIVFLLIVIFVFYGDSTFIKNITDIYTQFNKALPHVMAFKPWDMTMGVSGDAYGAISRIYAYKEALRVFYENPLFGCGFDMILSHSARFPENLFLQLLAETGIVGFALYLFFLITLYQNAKVLPLDFKFNKFYKIAFRSIIVILIAINMTGATLLIQKVWGPFILLSGFFYGYLKSEILRTSTYND